jgi:hypothetical protein
MICVGVPAVGNLTRARAAYCRGAAGAIEVLQPIAFEAARELDLLAPTRALHPSGGKDGKPTTLVIHRGGARAVAARGGLRRSNNR